MTNEKIDQLAQIIWYYHLMNHKVEKADCILALGSHDTRVAERAAELYLQNYAPIIIFSGGTGERTPEMWKNSEAEVFTKIAIKMGVPKEQILLENKSANTGENIQFTYNLIQQKNLHFKKIILVQTPYMERRTYATFMAQWPNKNTKFTVTSPQFSFQDYCSDKYPKDKIIAISVGYLERIKIYPDKGYQIYQEIPDNAWNAYLELLPIVKSGSYTNYLTNQV